MYIMLFTDTIFSPFTTTCIIFSNSDDDYGDDHYDDMDISQEIETPKTSRQQLPKKPLQLSAKNKTGVTRKNPVCPDCNKKFLKIKILEVHYRKRHNESAMPYTCRRCKKGYFTAPGLEMHVVQFHEDEESDDMAQSESESDDDELSSEEEVVPVKSAKKSNKQTPLKSEKTSSSVNKESQHIFRCLQCPMAFFEKSAFDKHINEAHKVSSVVTDAKKNEDLLQKMTDEQRKKYEALLDEVAMSAADELEASTILLCPDCDKYFRKRSDLEAHKKNEHGVNNKPQQDIKTQDVNNKSQEISQSNSPSTISEVSDVPEQKEKPVKSGSNCPICGKRYLNNSGLSSHLRCVHPHYKKSSFSTSASSLSYKKPVPVSPASSPKSKPSSENPDQNARPAANEPGASDTDCEYADAARTVGHLKRLSGGKFGCPECDKVYAEVRSVEKHILIQHTDMIMPFKCRFCPKSYMVESRVDHHTSKVHRDLDRTICPDSVSPASSPQSKPSSEKPDQNAPPVANDVGEDTIACHVCGHKTQTFAGLEQHIRDKHGPEQPPYRCGICSKSFLKPERVTSHAKCVHKTNVDVVQSETVSPPSAASDMDCEDADAARTVGHLKSISGGKFGCPECDKVYTEVRSVEKHILIQHTDMIMPFKCRFCPKSYMVESRVDHHTSKVHRDLDRTICPDSVSPASSPQSKPSSENPDQNAPPAANDVGEDTIKCHVCGHETQTFAGLELHIRDKHGPEQLPYHCGICSKGFLKPERVTSHAKCVHKTNVYVVQSQTVSPPPATSDTDCEDADAARTVGQLLWETSQGKFGCPECDKVYAEVRSVEKHILIEHTDMIMPFKCQFCPQSYMLESRVDYHISKVHRNHDQTIYPHCGTKCSSRKLMEHHFRYVHSELYHKYVQMPHKCQFCVRGFSEQSSLDVHLTHLHPNAIRQQRNAIPPSRRSVVEKRRASSPVSQQNTKKAKTLENPRSCPICKISFSKPTYVEEHFRTSHPDEPMPYRCMTCLRGFLGADRLQGHCERVHGIKVTLDQLVMTKEEPYESVHDVVDGDDVDSYTSDQDDYQSSVAVAETAAHDDDADSYTSNQDNSFSADQLRHNLIHTMLQQPTMLSDGSSSTSATPSQQLSQMQSRAVVPTAQAFSNVIVIEPEPTSLPIANSTIAGGFQPSEFRVLPSGSYNLLNLKPLTLQKLNAMTVTNSVGNTVRAMTEYPCTFCSKSYRKKRDYDRHIKVFHAATRVRFPCPICQVYSSYNKSDVKNHLQAKHQSEVLHTFNGLDGLMLNVESELVANPNAVPPGYDVRSTAGQVQESGNDNGNDGSGSSGILNAMFQAMN